MSNLKGKDIFLRPIEITDLQAVYDWENDPEIWEVSNTVNPLSRFFLEQYILNAQNNIYSDKQLRLIIETLEGQRVGSVDLFDFDAHNRRCGVGILIDRDYRNKGYASQALDLVIDYSRDTLNLHQLFCNINTDNQVSINLFTKKGFLKTGHKKHWNLRGNTWTDEYFMQRIFE